MFTPLFRKVISSQNNLSKQLENIAHFNSARSQEELLLTESDIECFLGTIKTFIRVNLWYPYYENKHIDKISQVFFGIRLREVPSPKEKDIENLHNVLEKKFNVSNMYDFFAKCIKEKHREIDLIPSSHILDIAITPHSIKIIFNDSLPRTVQFYDRVIFGAIKGGDRLEYDPADTDKAIQFRNRTLQTGTKIELIWDYDDTIYLYNKWDELKVKIPKYYLHPREENACVKEEFNKSWGCKGL